MYLVPVVLYAMHVMCVCRYVWYEDARRALLCTLHARTLDVVTAHAAALMLGWDSSSSIVICTRAAP